MKNRSYSSSGKDCSNRSHHSAICLGYWMSDIAHLILMVPLCGADVFIGKQRRYREVKLFFQGHTANKWWNLDSDFGGLDTKYLLITSLH